MAGTSINVYDHSMCCTISSVQLCITFFKSLVFESTVSKGNSASNVTFYVVV